MIINLPDERKQHGTIDHRHGKIENENAVALF